MRETKFAASLLALLLCLPLAADEVRKLPKPRMTGGKPLMEALKLRCSTRRYSAKPLSDQMLSDLLWAAFGINRPNGKRTAPSAVNWQEIDIYVADKDGGRLFQPKDHSLKRVVSRDIRAEIGRQGFVKTAPVILVFVADFTKMRRASEENKVYYSATDTGFISQNVYLFAASEDLGTVVIGLVNRKPLRKTLGLRPTQRIILAQPVGRPR